MAIPLGSRPTLGIVGILLINTSLGKAIMGLERSCHYLQGQRLGRKRRLVLWSVCTSQGSKHYLC